MSIRLQLRLSVGVLVLLVVAMAGGMLLVSSSLSAGGTHTDLSGRQRALSQRCAKEALIFSRAPTQANKEKLRVTIKVFDQSIEGMLNGGSVPSKADGSAPRQIVAVADAEAWRHAKREQEAWKPMKGAAERLIASEGKDDKALQYIIDNNAGVFAIANDMTGRLATSTAEKANLMMIAEGLVLLFSLIAAILTGVISGRISSSILELAEHADQISQGKRNSPVPTTGPGEVGVLGKSLDRMRISLTKAMEMIRAGNSSAPGLENAGPPQ